MADLPIPQPGGASDARTAIAPVPRISIQAFCESPEIAGVVNEAVADR